MGQNVLNCHETYNNNNSKLLIFLNKTLFSFENEYEIRPEHFQASLVLLNSHIAIKIIISNRQRLSLFIVHL